MWISKQRIQGSSSVSQNKGTNRQPKKGSHSGQGQGFSKKRKTKREVHHHLTNLAKSNSQSDSEAKGAASAKNTGPRSGRQQSDALDVRKIIDLTEDDVDSGLKDLPTQPVATTAEKLPGGISSPLTQEAEVASNEYPVQAESSDPNSFRKESGMNHSGFHEKCDLKPKPSIRALNFLDSYLLQHPDACSSSKTEKAPVPDSDKISEAKANILSSLALPLDEVMEIDCFQKFKSSLELLLKANGADVGCVRGKLEFLESKYHSAIAVTAEVHKEVTQKIELQDMVRKYSSRFSQAQQAEQKYLACINEQESSVEDIWKKIVEQEVVLKRLKENVDEEEAVLKRLKELHSKSKAKVNKQKFKFEQSHDMLHEDCINEETWVMKALQAKKDLESVGETWSQIRQCISLIL